MSLCTSQFHHRWFLKGFVSRDPWTGQPVPPGETRAKDWIPNHFPFLWNCGLLQQILTDLVSQSDFVFETHKVTEIPPSLTAFPFVAILNQNLLGVGKSHRRQAISKEHFPRDQDFSVPGWLGDSFLRVSVFCWASVQSVFTSVISVCTHPCMCRYMCTNVCAGTHAHVFTCMWKLRTTLGVISRVPCTFLDF